MKYLSVRYSKRKKKQVKSGTEAHESVCISIIVRVRDDGSLFQSFFYGFSQGSWLISIIVGCL